MSAIKVIRYRTNPQDADENARLIRDVFTELAADQPGGLRYASFRLDDGVSFCTSRCWTRTTTRCRTRPRSRSSSPVSGTGAPTAPPRPTRR